MERHAETRGLQHRNVVGAVADRQHFCRIARSASSTARLAALSTIGSATVPGQPPGLHVKHVRHLPIEPRAAPPPAP
jgi:hypothetical protein